MNSIKYGWFALSVFYGANIYAQAQVVEATPLEPEQIRAQTPVMSVQASGLPAQPANLSLEQRIFRLEQQLQNRQQLDLIGQVANLQQAIEQLRGQMDIMNHQQQQLEQRLNNFYQDLSKRLEEPKTKSKPVTVPVATQPIIKPKPAVKNKMLSDTRSATDLSTQAESAPADSVVDNFPLASSDQMAVTAAAEQPVSQASKVDTAEQSATDSIQEQNAYQTAYNALKNRNYAQAIPAMESYLQTYPSGKYVANAHYWLGELYLVQSQADKAASQFKLLISQYPNDTKLADATLKLGIIYYNKGQYQDAKNTFNEVKSKFPGSAAARLAQRRLQEMADSAQ